MSWFRSLADLDNTYSEGETKLFIELQERHRTIGMVTHRKIALDKDLDGVNYTETDFLWGPPKYTAYLDCEDIHEEDDEIDALTKKGLERLEWTVDRFRYKMPMSNRRCREIADAIEKRLEKL